MTNHSYIFFSTNPAFYSLSKEKQKLYKNEFAEALKKEEKVITYTYATLGLKTNTNILLWMQSETIDDIQIFIGKLVHTNLGRYLNITYTLFGMARPTQYSDRSAIHLKTKRKGGKYLIIYPFTKTKEWHMMDFKKRKNLMLGHIMVGKKYPQIEQVLLYSYGVDDSEFIVSYETDDLLLFQGLVMELRTDKVREYTYKDTPIFTCIYKTPQDLLDFI